VKSLEVKTTLRSEMIDITDRVGSADGR